MTNILIAADYCPSKRVAEEIDKRNYEAIFGKIKQIEADYKIVNFECAVASNEDYPIKKCGPTLKCSPKGIDALVYAGFDCVTLANNHFFDYGQSGVEKTLAQLKAQNMDYVGGGVNLDEAQQTLYKTINDETFAFVNCCEHEFSIATEQLGGSNPLNPITQWYAITEAKTKVKHVVVIVHGGPEHYALPSPRMVETYRFFIDAGADAVINHHQHCLSGYEEYHGKPIFYGLGNFCFDLAGEQYTSWNKGYMVQLRFNNKEIEFELIPYCQCYLTPGVEPFENEYDIVDFQNRINFLNEIITNPQTLTERYGKYLKKWEKFYRTALEPYSNRITLSLYNKGLLPSFVKRNKKLLLFNYLSCESHFEKLLNTLK